jgi:hypothetical protein
MICLALSAFGEVETSSSLYSGVSLSALRQL